MTINIPPEGKGALRLMCRALIMDQWRECEIEDANAATQWAIVRIQGSLFRVGVKFIQIANVCLKWDNGIIEKSFGSPKVENPESIAYIKDFQNTLR